MLFSKTVALMLQFCKPVHQNGSPNLFCKAAPKTCALKLLPEAAVQSYCPKAATFQTSTPKRLPKAILQSGSRKLLPEVVCKNAPERCCSWKQLFLKVAPAILPNLLFKAAVQSYCPNAAILQIYTLKRLPKAFLQSGSRKLLLKTAPRSGLCTNRS